MSETDSDNDDETEVKLPQEQRNEIAGYFEQVQVLLADSEHREPLSEIGLAIENLHKDVAQMKIYLWFVEKYLEQRRILSHTTYIGRKDIDITKGDLGEHEPSLRSLRRELEMSYSSPRISFFLQSYIYILSRPYCWAPLYIYTTNSYRKINAAIASKDFSDTDVKTLYEVFTDIHLPVLTPFVQLARCVISTPKFDVSLAASFTSYQLTSTTLNVSKGICLESEGYDYIAMHLTCNNVPALFIGFSGTTHRTSEREVVLCPGLRFEWDKTTYFEEHDMKRISDDVALTKSTNGQYIGKYNGKRIFYRNYIARVIDHPILNELPIEARTKDVMTFFNYVNNIYNAERQKRVEQTVASFISKTKAKAKAHTKPPDFDITSSVTLDDLLAASQDPDRKRKERNEYLDKAEQEFIQMEKYANVIYMPWTFDAFEVDDEDPEQDLLLKQVLDSLKPIKRRAPKLHAFLIHFQARPSQPWKHAKTFTTNAGRKIQVQNTGKEPAIVT